MRIGPMPKLQRLVPWILSLCAMGLAGAAQAQTCVKSLRWVNAAPYAFKDAQGHIRGLHIDLAREALRRMDCTARLVEMPWTRALVELQLGRLDLLPGAAKLPQREAFAYFSRPTNRARNILVVTPGAKARYQLTALSDIIGTDFRLAAQRGSSYNPEYERLLQNPAFTSRLTYVYSQQSGLLMMQAGRAEGMLVDEAAGLYQVRAQGLEKSVVHSGVVSASEVDFIAISKASNDVAFVKRFNDALGAMLADGSTKKILERYLACPVNIDKLGCQ